MIRAGAGLLVLLVWCVCVDAQSPEQAGAEALAKGRGLFDQGKYDEALTHFARARAEAPGDWRGHAYQSMALLQLAAAEPAPARRHALLQESQSVAAVLVKRRLVDLKDPLYKFLRGVALSMEGDDGRAFMELASAMRAPAGAFRKYEEVQLRQNLERAYGTAAVAISDRLVAHGRYADAERELERADPYIADEGLDRLRCERLRAAAARHLGRVDDAVKHLRRCIELLAGNEAACEELLGTIAAVYLGADRTDEGEKALDEAKESRHPEVVAARCLLRYQAAMRERGQALDAALAYYREQIDASPVDFRYRLVLQFVELVLAKVGEKADGAEAGKKDLLLEAVRRARPEIELRPECPELYGALARVFPLLKEEAQAVRYKNLFERKKKELALKDRSHCR